MKKINQKGFTHHVIMFAVLALVLVAMGFAGYRVWQNSNKDAKAGGYTSLGSMTGTSFLGCKSYISVDGGGKWKIKLSASVPVKKLDNTKYSFGFLLFRKGSTVATVNFGPLGSGQSSSKYLYAFTGDKYTTEGGAAGRGFAGSVADSVSIDNLKGC